MGEGVVFWEYPDPLVWWHLCIWGCFVAFGSFCIGATGAGGIIVVPSTLLLPGMTGPVAIGTCNLGFYPMSLLKAVIWHRAGKVPWRRSVPLIVTGLPCGFAGQFIVAIMPKLVLGLIVSGFCVLAGTKAMQTGIRSLRDEAAAPEDEQDEAAEQHEAGTRAAEEPNPVIKAAPAQHKPDLPDLAIGPDELTVHTSTVKSIEVALKVDIDLGEIDETPPEVDPVASEEPLAQDWCEFRLLLFVGGFVAFCASISGSGSPLIFFPVMLFLRPEMPMHTMIGLTVPFGLSLGTGTLVGGYFFNTIDVALSMIMGTIAMTFVALGSRYGLRMNNGQLRIALGATLLLCALVLIVKYAVLDSL